MQHKIATYLDNVITFLLLAVAGLLPLLFFNQTTEFYEVPKMAFLAVAVVLILGLWIFSWIVNGKVTIIKTPLDIPLLVLLGVVLASTFTSVSRYPAIFGNITRIHGSAVSYVVYVLLYFVTVSHLTSMGKIKSFLYVLYGSGVLVALLTLMSYFGLYLPFDFAQAANFTPTGSSFSTVAFLLMLLPWPLLSLISGGKGLPTPFALGMAILFGVTVALTGSVTTLVVLLLVLVGCVLFSGSRGIKGLTTFIVPVAVVVFTLMLTYLPFPGNVVQQLGAKFPKEIQLPLSISWKVSVSAFRDAPFIGTGPATYLFNFTGYKPLEFNAKNYWNFSFDTAYNELLQVLGTLGILGLGAVVIICLVVLGMARKGVGQDGIVAALSVSAVTAVVLMLVHSTTLVSFFVTLLVFAALMMVQESIRERISELSIGLKAATSNNKQFDLFPIILFVLFLVGAIPALYQTYKVVMADYYHRQALAQANRNGSVTYQFLQKAESLNPYVDLYRVDMAQTNFALANAIVAQRSANQKNAQVNLSDADKQTIQTLISQAIAEGRASVALSPRSARNWEVLASIYRNINGVAKNATTFSLDAYGRAIQLDPLNPTLRLNVGGIYSAAKNYDMASRFFTDAANLKADYADAYYNLALTLRDKGDVQNAKAVAEQTVALLVKNGGTETPDYKIANSLLTDLKDKVAKLTPVGSGETIAPATQTNTAIEKAKLPGVDVSGLNNPPEVSTPSAVRPNPDANIPQITPTP
jgi:tetratricopeptide (TPR) repeat protein